MLLVNGSFKRDPGSFEGKSLESFVEVPKKDKSVCRIAL
jgi:hypothetical protein